MKYHIGDHWQAKFELTRFDVDNRKTTGRAEINAAWFGVACRF